jgi:hypothetical protein
MMTQKLGYAFQHAAFRPSKIASMVWAAAINTLTKRKDAAFAALFREPARGRGQIFCRKIFLCHRFVKHDAQRDEFRAFNKTSHKIHLAALGAKSNLAGENMRGRICACQCDAHRRSVSLLSYQARPRTEARQHALQRHRSLDRRDCIASPKRGQSASAAVLISAGTRRGPHSRKKLFALRFPIWSKPV